MVSIMIILHVFLQSRKYEGTRTILLDMHNGTLKFVVPGIITLLLENFELVDMDKPFGQDILTYDMKVITR